MLYNSVDMPALIKNITTETSEAIINNGPEVKVRSISVTNTASGKSTFTLLQKKDSSVGKMLPDITLDNSDPDGKGTFVYNDFLVASQYGLYVDVSVGQVSVYISYE